MIEEYGVGIVEVEYGIATFAEPNLDAFGFEIDDIIAVAARDGGIIDVGD